MGEVKSVMCPFLKQNCIQEKCGLFLELPILTQGPLVGVTNRGGARGCSFTLTAFFLNRLSNSVSPVPNTDRISRG